MDRPAVLAAFDEQIRRHPMAGASDAYVEDDEKVVRCIGGADGWNGVTWSALTDTDAGAVIAAQVHRFEELGRPWEWKHYSYDRPVDLPARLLAPGLTAEPAEAGVAPGVAQARPGRP